MPKIFLSSLRTASAAAVAAIAAVAFLAGFLASPDTLARLATTEAMGGATPREARITVSMTGDVVVPSVEPIAVLPTALENHPAGAPASVFRIGDRISVAGRDGIRRTLEVIDVGAGGLARALERTSADVPGLVSLVLVTCRVLDAAGHPVPGSAVRFLAAGDPAFTQVGAPSLSKTVPGTL